MTNLDGDAPARRAGVDFSKNEVMWKKAPPPVYLEEPEAAGLCQRILHDLIDIGEVDCDRMVQIVQLMAYREFDAFFRALCQVSLENPSRTADRLTRCANRLIPG